MINWLYKQKDNFFIKYVLKKLRHINMVIIFYRDPERSKVFDVVNEIKDSKYSVGMTANECMQICSAVINTNKLDGDVAEVGTYTGGSAELICRFKGNKNFYVFDCFDEGLKDILPIDKKGVINNEFDASDLKNGMFRAPEQITINRLSNYSNVHIYKGYFPETVKDILNKKFSYVNFDVDTYKSTLSCLKFFYPRMVKGGIMMSHDYVGMRGVRKAVDEFFKIKPEPIIEMSGSQCLIVKV